MTPKSLDNHCRSIGDIITETQLKGTLLDRLDRVEDQVIQDSEQMETNSDSDKSYDIVIRDEFYKSVTESDSDHEGSAKNEMAGSDLNKLPADENEHKETVNYSGNSCYDDDSSDPDDAFDMPELAEPEAVAASDKRKRALEVPTDFENPRYIKRRQDVNIKDLVKYHALLFLPAKSLTRFKAVSKEWNQWISSPFFAHKQTYCFRGLSGFFCQAAEYMAPTYESIDKHTYGTCSLGFLPEGVNIRSSCYGLLLCQGICDDNAYYVCNPVSNEYRKILQPDFYHGQDPAIVLAFEPSELNIQSHFTIICAIPILTMDQAIVNFEIYSSETKIWRLSSVDCIELKGSKILGGGFYVNKIVYFTTDSGKVLGFDSKNEICGVLTLPLDCAWNGVLTRMEGELRYVCVSHLEGNMYTVRVYGGMDMSLKKNIEVCLSDVGIGICRVLPFVTNEGDNVAILAGEAVWLYRMREKRTEIIGLVRSFGGKYFPFVSSLVHLPPAWPNY